jgi:hypothetical protein
MPYLKKKLEIFIVILTINLWIIIYYANTKNFFKKNAY